MNIIFFNRLVYDLAILTLLAGRGGQYEPLVENLESFHFSYFASPSVLWLLTKH